MNFLILAIMSSALVSIGMRLGNPRVKSGMGMLLMNYMTCTVLAALYAGVGRLVPLGDSFGKLLGLGAVTGFVYLYGFMLFQRNVSLNGVVLSSVFMKLGLLVPVAMSVFLFGEQPGLSQLAGFVIAVAAIILINMKKDAGSAASMAKLLLMLLVCGTADAMSKVYDHMGPEGLEAQFLFYTFLVALILCGAVMLKKGERVGAAECFFGMLIGIPNFFSSRFLLKALSQVPAVIVYPCFSVGTLLIITLAGVVFFREKLRRGQWMAVGLILLALVLLNL